MADKENRTTLHIEGMMCPHCEARVRDALNAVPGVNVLSISHESNSAEIEAAGSVTPEQLKTAVTGAGYELVG